MTFIYSQVTLANSPCLVGCSSCFKLAMTFNLNAEILKVCKMHNAVVTSPINLGKLRQGSHRIRYPATFDCPCWTTESIMISHIGLFWHWILHIHITYLVNIQSRTLILSLSPNLIKRELGWSLLQPKNWTGLILKDDTLCKKSKQTLLNTIPMGGLYDFVNCVI